MYLSSTYSTYAGNWSAGFKDYPQFIALLQEAINDEASAIQFYDQLVPGAPPDYRDFVTHARDDEVTHLQMFRRLYRKLTGSEASVTPTATPLATYKRGVETAFRNELKAAELYRDMYLSTRIPKVRNVLFKAMTDEMEHAQRFSFLYFLPS